MAQAARILVFTGTFVCLLFLIHISPIYSQDLLYRGGRAITLSRDRPGNYHLLSAVEKKYVSARTDVGLPPATAHDPYAKSEHLSAWDVIGGLWYCCLNTDYVDYFYHSAKWGPRRKLYAARKTPRSYNVLAPGGGEVVVSPGLMEGSLLLSGVVRKSLSTCFDVGGSMITAPHFESRTELFFTTEIRYGLWFCCIPEYYLDYLYFSAGAGSNSQMGQGERENAFVLSYGTGLRFDVLGAIILGAEVKAFAIFRDEGRVDRVALFLGGGFPL
jgi:hypothetical protein